MFFPATAMAFELNQRRWLQESALITLCAILRYQSQYGTFPDNLQELINKGFIKRIPQDPFNNEPLTYKKVGDTFTLYSCGMNFIDEGGKIIRNRYGRIDDYSNNGDMVFWPRPKETEQEKQKRLKEQQALGIEED